MNQDTSKTLGRFYLIRNAAYADLDEARRLLENDATLINEKNSLGETALHFLVVENQLDAVKFLAQHGADVNTRNDFDDAAIAEAAQLGYVEMVKLLLELGAKINEKELAEATEYGIGYGGMNRKKQARILAVWRDFDKRKKA